MLDDLLKVKKLREDDAISELARAESDLERKVAAHESKQRERSDYDTWRIAEEEHLYRDIQGKEVSVDDLEELRERIASLRQRGLQLEEEVERAAHEVERARNTVAEARRARVVAYKEVTKFDEYNRILVDERRRDLERREEAELEDLISARPSP